MKKILPPLIVIFLLFLISCSNNEVTKESSSLVTYSDEGRATLGRGIIAYQMDRNHTLLSWRLLPEDGMGVSFDIYRKEFGTSDEHYKKIARTDRTSYTDPEARGKQYVYTVRPFQEGKKGKVSRESIPLSSIKGKAALVINIGQPYKQARVVTGDLNGDGEPEFVVAYSGYQAIDPHEAAWSKSEDTMKVAAFLATGDRLWKLDLGWGIEAGETYQPLVVWDLDGDGRAEVILKTNKSSNPLEYGGERITVLDGMSGQIKKEAKWPSVPWSPARRMDRELSGVAKGTWSDYNNDSRNYLAIAHLDGKNPFIIAARGTYKSQRMWAFDKNLHRVWERSLGLDHYYAEGFPNTSLELWDRLTKFWNVNDKMNYLWARYTKKRIMDLYRGSHSLPIADINEDGKEVILWGERCIGENGKDLWAIQEKIPYPGHPDVVFAADILPSHKGKEIFFGREGGVGKNEKIGVYLADYQGYILWAHWGYHHIDQGWVGKIVPGQAGMQCVGVDIKEKEEAKEGPWKIIEPMAFLWSSDGKLLGQQPASWYSGFPVDWDGDGVREIVNSGDGEVQKYGGSVLQRLSMECLWGADLFGDHREEIVAAPGDGNIYVFFNPGVPNSPPRVTPMADRQYKNDLSRTAMQARVIPTEGGVIPGKFMR